MTGLSPAVDAIERAGAPSVANEVDNPVLAKLRQHGIVPASVCSDAVFVRRVYLDVLGTLPSPAEERSFLEDRSPDQRRRLIDQLLERKEFADYWALKWCDLLRVKSEFPINLWPNAVQTYHRWVRDSLAENKPYDRFVREILTASGSNFRAPPFVSFLFKSPTNVQDASILPGGKPSRRTSSKMSCTFLFLSVFVKI
jgi:hypothetical protein